MTQPDDDRDEALARLKAGLEAYDKQHAPKPPSLGGIKFAHGGAGYRLIGELIGGLLGGIGLGWVVDRLTGWGPWGLIGGLIIGVVASTWVAVLTVRRMSRQNNGAAGPDAGGRDKQGL